MMRWTSFNNTKRRLLPVVSCYIISITFRRIEFQEVPNSLIIDFRCFIWEMYKRVLKVVMQLEAAPFTNKIHIPICLYVYSRLMVVVIHYVRGCVFGLWMSVLISWKGKGI